MTIIDANNLAGKLNLLTRDNFDQELIKLLKKYKNRDYTLVFDGRDTMGDSYQLDNVRVIYAPRDSYYKSADDKIIELTEQYLKSGETIILVTDDLEIIDQAKKLLEGSSGNIIFEKASFFAKNLIDYLENIKEEKELSDDEADEITEELLNKWK